MIKKLINEWKSRVTLKNLDMKNWSICPFAHKVLEVPVIVVNTLTEQEIENRLKEIAGNEVTVFTVGSTAPSFDEIDKICHSLNKKHKEFIFLPDHPEIKNYIAGHETGNQNFSLILAQSKESLLKHRELLLKTDYYSFWTPEYQKEIFSYGEEE